MKQKFKPSSFRENESVCNMSVIVMSCRVLSRQQLNTHFSLRIRLNRWFWCWIYWKTSCTWIERIVCIQNEIVNKGIIASRCSHAFALRATNFWICVHNFYRNHWNPLQSTDTEIETARSNQDIMSIKCLLNAIACGPGELRQVTFSMTKGFYWYSDVFDWFGLIHGNQS